MAQENELDRRVLRAIREVERDIADGVVPDDVTSFSALHDYVDANYYGGLFEDDCHLTMDEMNDLQTRVAVWLTRRDPNW